MNDCLNECFGLKIGKGINLSKLMLRKQWDSDEQNGKSLLIRLDLKTKQISSN